MLPRLDIAKAIEAMQAGGSVVFPTETCFGIGCRAYDANAVDGIMRAKNRPQGKPLPVLLPDIEYLKNHGLESPLFPLGVAFWPGPLTLVVPAFPGLPAQVTAGTHMVGVRVSAHPIAQALVSGLGEPMVATSANLTGEPAPASVEECDQAGLVGVAGLVPAEPVAGSASTVVGMIDGDLVIHRVGPIGEDALRRVWRP